MRAPRRLVPVTLVLTLAVGTVAWNRADGPAATGPAASNPAATPVTAPATASAPPAVPAVLETATKAPMRSVADTGTVEPVAGPVRGRAALRVFGDQLPAVARLNDRGPAELRRLLVDDPTIWLDSDGHLFVKDALPAEPARAAAGAAAAFPLDQTFALHSAAGSRRTIFLDFDGVDVAGGAWTDQGLPAGQHEGWDPVEDGASFEDRERAAIQEVWQRVAEDFAPFDVDVTTQDPGPAALTRTSPADLDYGTHLVVTDSDSAWSTLCARSCGGLAWLGAFGTAEQDGEHQLAWVFAPGVGDLARTVAEAAAHEIGHTLDLTHDGSTPQGADSYYAGHAPWAPIMGAGYGHGVTQWSRGDYADATNQQDDVAVIAAHAPLRTDEAGDSLVTAARSTGATSYITARTDVDYVALGTCTGSVTVAAQPATTGANLDVALRLVDADGTVVAAAAPATTEQQVQLPYPWLDQATYAGPQVTGLDASVTTTLPAGRYYAVVDGGGAQEGGGGDPVTDYDDYGSLGAYTLSTTGCDANAVTRPRAPTALSTTMTADGLRADWAAPLDDGGAELLGYDLRVDDGTPVRVAPEVTSHTWPDLTTGSHTVSVAAVNVEGQGPAATGSARRTVPNTPQLFYTYTGPDAQGEDPSLLYFYTAWFPSADQSGGLVTSYRLEYEIRPGVWQVVREMPVLEADDDKFYEIGVTLPPGFPPSQLRVIARNDLGDSAPLTVTGQIPGPPMSVSGVVVTPDKLAHTLRVDWTDPYDGGRPLLGTQVALLPPDDDHSSPLPASATDVKAGTNTVVFTDVPAGEHLIAFEPYNELGARRSARWATMPALTPPSWISEFAPLVVDARAGTATVSWTAPATDPDLPILGYDVTVDDASPLRVTGTSHTLTGLALGSTHSVQVAAVNLGGTALAQGPAPFRVVTTPTPVTDLQATVNRSVPGSPVVDATWTASTDNGGEEGGPEYQWRLLGEGADPATAYWQTSREPSLRAQWGVTAGRYTLQVRAHNAQGESATTSVPVVVRDTEVPGLVGDLTGTLDVAAGTATATWTAPADDGGSSIEGYGYWVDLVDVTEDRTVSTASVIGTGHTVTDLVRGHAYRLDVRAQNPVGSGPTASWAFVAADRPGLVGALSAGADRLARTVTVTWAAPDQTGGAPLVGYRVRLGEVWSPTLSATTTSYVFTGVGTGSHDVLVETDNGAGTSTATTAVTMLPEPVVAGAVGGLRLTTDATRGRVALAWSAPTADGGTPVTGYVVTVGSQVLTTAGTTLTVSGLALGATYRVTVGARNAVGTGTTVSQSFVLTTRPGAPRISTASPGAPGGTTTAVFRWLPPAVTGGSPVTGYEVTVLTLKKGRPVASKAVALGASARSYQARLPAKKGVTYAAVVRVRTAVGWSPLSARSKAVAPR